MDREKVIKEYEDYVNSYISLTTSYDYEFEMHKAVLALLKEQQEIVRCEDCQFHYAGENEVDAWDRCRLHSINTEPDNYCSWAVANRR